MDNAPALTGMGGGMPDVGSPTPQPVQQAAPPQAPAAAPPQADPAQVADVQHHALLGKAFKNLMGMNTNYTVDPASGQVVADQTPNKPGQFFKAVLAASLLGGEAGANGNPAQGFMGGLVRGAGASMAQANQQDALKRQQAQQQYADQMKAQENQRAQQTQDRETMMAEATVQNMHSEMVARDRMSDHADKEAHDKHNAASAAVENVLLAAGGTPAKIVTSDGAKDSMTAPELADAYTKDQSIRQGPPGFVRHFLDTTDASELEFVGGRWVTSDGTPVNMSDKTMVKAIDVPIDVMGKKVEKPNTVINDAIGYKLLDPKGSSWVSPNDIDGLNTKRMAGATTQANLARVQAETEASKASAAHSYAEAAKTKEETKESKEKAGLVSELADPKNVGADGANQAFIDDVKKTNPQYGSLIEAIGKGLEIPNAHMLSRKEGMKLMADVHAAYPDYNVSKATGYQQLQKSYTAGKDKDQIEALNTSYRHMAQAFSNASNPFAIVPGTPAHAVYNSDTQQLKEEINSAYTHGVLTKEKAGALEGDLLSALPATRRSALKEIFALLADKTEEKQRTWQRGKPSAVISDFKILSPEAQQAYHAVTGKAITATGMPAASTPKTAPVAPPSGAVAIGKGTDGKQYYLDANHQPLGPVQ